MLIIYWQFRNLKVFLFLVSYIIIYLYFVSVLCVSSHFSIRFQTYFRVTRFDYMPGLIFFASGLFAYSHMDFDVDRNTNDTGDPSLAEMAIKALRILANNPEGYFLFVEGKSEITISERKSHLQLCSRRRKE